MPFVQQLHKKSRLMKTSWDSKTNHETLES